MSDRLARVAASGAGIIKLSGQDLFAADFRMHRADSVARVRVAVFVGAASILLVPSSGSAFALNGGANIAAGTVHVEDVPLDTDRTWNLQTASVAIACDASVTELSMVA